MARLTRKKQVRAEEEEFDVDDPSEVDEAQNDGDSSSNENSSARRKSGRQRTLKKAYKDDGSSDDDEDQDDESEEEKTPTKKKTEKKKPKGPPRGGRRGKPPAKKTKVEEENDESDDIDGEESEGDAADTPLEYRSGCFVVLKTDIDNNQEDHPLWKIDGKSLLQKFDKTIKEEEVFYKSTTTYAGWSKSVMDTYYPIKVEFEKVDGCNGTYVKFLPSQLEQIKKEKKEEVEEVKEVKEVKDVKEENDK